MIVVPALVRAPGNRTRLTAGFSSSSGIASSPFCIPEGVGVVVEKGPGRIWMMPSNPPQGDFEFLRKQTHLPRPALEVLLNRGLSDPDQIHAMLDGDLWLEAGNAFADYIVGYPGDTDYLDSTTIKDLVDELKTLHLSNVV